MADNDRKRTPQQGGYGVGFGAGKEAGYQEGFMDGVRNERILNSLENNVFGKVNINPITNKVNYRQSDDTSIFDGCFITTATCKSRNLPDDCHELTSLRKFRDEFMKKDELMKSEVEEYYRIAPAICEKIDKEPNSSEIYESIWQNHLKAAVEAVDNDEKQKAHDIYKEMVIELKEKYL